MNQITLSKDTDFLICSMYKTYKEKLESGIPKDDATLFGDADEICESVNIKWSSKDLMQPCFELQEAGLLDVSTADDKLYEPELKSSAIVYMENRFKNGLLGVVDFLTKFIP